MLKKKISKKIKKIFKINWASVKKHTCVTTQLPTRDLVTFHAIIN